ncbi:MAG: AbgT family transporter [Alcanivoracaceae bacterium]|nr:AbgT family transporter [Alcanivoracaceae bacterium]
MSATAGWLSRLERLGNRLPHPTLLFVWLCLLLLPVSALVSVSIPDTAHPLTGDPLPLRSLLSAEGVRWMLTSMVSNFTGFAPLGIVLVAMLGIGVAEHSGLLGSVLSAIVQRASQRLLVPLVAFAGVLSSIAADAGYVVLIPLAALLFQRAGRSPLTGIAVAFAGVSGGFSANLLLGPIDALLAGISTEAARTLQPDSSVGAAANYWFMLVSTVLVTVVITLMTRSEQSGEPAAPLDQQTTSNRTMLMTLLGLGGYLLAIAALTLPNGAPLRHPDTGDLLSSPFMQGIVIVIALGFAVCGLIFGYSSGTFRNGSDVIRSLEKTVAQLAGYLVLMFFAAQFVAWFNWSGMALVMAVNGAEALTAINLPTPLLMIALILLVAVLNLLIGSASAKWALLAPLLIPMLMLAGIQPEATQAAFRVGDSSTNLITPLMPYFALVLGFVRQHKPDAGIGTLMAMMLPYSIALLLAWSLLLAIWLGFGWPLGPA